VQVKKETVDTFPTGPLSDLCPTYPVSYEMRFRLTPAAI